MEKIWICYFRIFIFSILVNSLFAAEMTKDAFVEVQVPVERGNIADAKLEAEKKAFDTAIEQNLPQGISDEKRQEILKQSSRWIKNFQKIGERQSGNILTVKYRVEVILSAASEIETQKLDTLIPVRFEIALTPKGPKLSSSELVRYVQEQWRLTVQDLRLSRGNIRFEVSLPISIGEAEAQLSQFVGNRGSVRAFEVKSAPDVDSGVLPAQPPVASPEGNFILMPSNPPMVSNEIVAPLPVNPPMAEPPSSVGPTPSPSMSP